MATLRPGQQRRARERAARSAVGCSASFVALASPSAGRFPLEPTAAERILPDDLPFPPPELER